MDFNLNGFSDNDDNDVKEKKKLEAGIFCVSVVDKVWKYRGEGGANLVISLSGEKQVIRRTLGCFAKVPTRLFCVGLNCLVLKNKSEPC